MTQADWRRGQQAAERTGQEQDGRRTARRRHEDDGSRAGDSRSRSLSRASLTSPPTMQKLTAKLERLESGVREAAPGGRRPQQ